MDEYENGLQGQSADLGCSTFHCSFPDTKDYE